MKFYKWKNKSFGSYDIFLQCNIDEVKEIQKIFPKEDVVSATSLDTYYYFLDTKNKIITPMNCLSFAFGGMYNDYLPYGTTPQRIEFNLSEYRFIKKTKHG